MRDLQNDLRLCRNATPGPWSWNVNNISKNVVLQSNEWTVMDFVPWHTQSAQPRFGYEGLMDKASDLAIERKAHHVGFDMDIMHDDAQFIAQAREGWPHAIERAIKAEALNRELVEALATAIDIAYTPDEDFIRDENFELIRCGRVLAKVKEALNDES